MNSPLIGEEVRDSGSSLGERSYRIYKYNNMVLYQLQNQVEEDKAFALTEKKKSSYFIFHKDSNYVIRYDPDWKPDSRRIRLDSALIYIKGTNTLYSFTKLKPDSANWSNNKNELREVYIFPENVGMPKGYIVMYYSKDLNDLDEFLNKDVDSLKQMKLYKVETVLGDFYSVAAKRTFPGERMVTVLQKTAALDKEELMAYFKKYEKYMNQKQ